MQTNKCACAISIIYTNKPMIMVKNTILVVFTQNIPAIEDDRQVIVLTWLA